MNRLLFLAALIAVPALLSLGGCAFWREPYRETLRYELIMPVPDKVSSAISVQTFRNISSAGRRMYFRESDGRLREVPFTEWAQSPERLLVCALNGMLAGKVLPPNVNKVEVNGILWQFLLDSEAKKAFLGVNYEIKCYFKNDKTAISSGTLRLDAPLAGESGKDAAAAMSKCATMLAENMEKIIWR